MLLIVVRGVTSQGGSGSGLSIGSKSHELSVTNEGNSSSSENEDEDLMEMIRPPSASAAFKGKPSRDGSASYSDDARATSPRSSKSSSSHSSEHNKMSSSRSPKGRSQSVSLTVGSSSSESSNGGGGWKRNILNADDLGSLMELNGLVEATSNHQRKSKPLAGSDKIRSEDSGSPSHQDSTPSSAASSSTSNSSDSDSDGNWKRNVMDANDLGLLMAANGLSEQVNSLGDPLSSEGQSQFREGQGFSPSRISDSSKSSSHGSIASGLGGLQKIPLRHSSSSSSFEASKSSSRGSIASGLGGLQRMPSRDSSSSRGSINVMRSADLADLMSGLGLKTEEETAWPQETTQPKEPPLQATQRCSVSDHHGLASGLSQSGEGMVYGGMEVAPTWRATDGIDGSAKGSSGGTMTYSDENDGAEEELAAIESRGSLLLGPPQPSFRPLPTPLTFGNHQVSIRR